VDGGFKMAVLINFKICDNSKECEGIKACPTGAFAWDEENKTIVVHEDLCVNCGKCECCTVNAIKVTHSDEEYEKAKKEIDEDTRTINDLLVDRYGAQVIQEIFVINGEDINNILQSHRPIMLELYEEDNTECLLKSIPIKDLLLEFDKTATYRKVGIITNKLLDKYKIKELPALVFIKDQKVLGTIEGYYTDENSRELIEKIHEIKNS
jgi:NAD-dependent dihydropyrimidine dehydrogenase PreA subunit